MKQSSIVRAFTITACVFALSIDATGAGARAGAGADTITLKSAVRHDREDNIITLANVATLEGEEALRLADVQVGAMRSADKPLELCVADVRAALDAAGVNWARVHLNGRSVVVRPTRLPHGPHAHGATAPTAMSPSAIPTDRANQPIATADTDAEWFTLDDPRLKGSVGGMIAELMATTLQVDAGRVRVRPVPDDLPLLRTALDSARFEIQPLGSLAGDRVALSIRCWEGARSVERGQLTLSVQRRVAISTAARDLRRLEPLDVTAIATTEQWVSPSEASQAAAVASIAGRVVTRSLRAGEVVRQRDLEHEAIVKRGQMLTVRCLVGGVAISLQAEARSDGSLGERIEFRKSGERETFLATITGPDQAVIDLNSR